jgi:thiol-disulfide isomerase/thioredoxin
MTEDQRTKGGSGNAGQQRRPAFAILGILIAAAAGYGLYGMLGSSSKKAVAHSGVCARSLDMAQSINPLVHGEIAGLAVASQPNPLDQIAFNDAAGTKTTLASFAGKAVLLNLWATWCVPCRTEMPSLDKLQASLGSQRFAVVPVNIDTTRLDRPRAFLKEIGATDLPFYSDSTADIMQTLLGPGKLMGLPTTVIVGPDGCEIATLAGPADWASAEAKALIEKIKALAPSST